VIDRANRARWKEEGGHDLEQRAHSEVERLIQTYKPSGLSSEIKKELKDLMLKEARKYGQDKLPEPKEQESR